MTSQNNIITLLLDKFEGSKHLFEPGISNRRVMLKSGQKEWPDYDYEIADIRDEFNAAAQSLEKAGMVQIEWIPHRPVMQAVVLNLSVIDECYRMVGRVHPKERAQRIEAMITARLSLVETTWIRQWRDTVCLEARTRYKVPSYCMEDTMFLSELLTAFFEYDALHGGPVTMRAFSSRCYHDTKHFEKTIRDTFLRIALQYHAELSELCQNEEFGAREQLAFLGIYARPELYELTGNCVVETPNGRIAIGAAGSSGIALPGTIVDDIQAIHMENICRITFIENKTNYDEYICTERSDDELVLYHGGFSSPQKRKFFAALASDIPVNIPIYFWADIDLGGFEMFERLRKIFPALQPMRMSVEDVEKYHDRGLARPDEYWKRMNTALEFKKYPLFHEVLQRLIKYRVTIEQEVFLV